MKDRTAKCPKCGKEIFRYAQICPYCKSETKFVSIDDEKSQSRVEEEIKVTTEEEPASSGKTNLPVAQDHEEPQTDSTELPGKKGKKKQKGKMKKCG